MRTLGRIALVGVIGAATLGLTRQWLHARQLGFDHPRTGERVTVTSEYPEDLAYALEVLESGKA